MRYSIVILLVILSIGAYAQKGEIRGKLSTSDNAELSEPVLMLQNTVYSAQVEANGAFRISNVSYGSYTLVAFALGYDMLKVPVKMDSAVVNIELTLVVLSQELDAIKIQGERSRSFGIKKLSPFEGTSIYEGKKTEVIILQDMTVNLSTNNPRQIYSKITGLHIWESDPVGLQLGIGGRGLSPQRTSNFNTRQNGYDISADALGYPESYYTPPAEAIERIEVVRGAASLQYGTQFGGLLNFVMKKAPDDKKWEASSRQSLGSFGYFGSFNSFAGNAFKKKLSYYSFYQYKKGDGWRENSRFEAHTGYLSLTYKPGKSTSHTLEYTVMRYLAQQPGGHTDATFEDDPRASFRKRNWFGIAWNLLAWQMNYSPNNENSFNFRTFGLIANRRSLGNLERINVVDFNGNRNLIYGDFANVGHEGRWLRHFNVRSVKNTSVLGYRIYYGSSKARQGDGNNASGPDFYFLNPKNLENSNFRFSNYNASLFWENIINISNRWSITPGMRYEYIKTGVEGYYKQRVTDAAGNLIVDNKLEDEKEKQRTFAIAGIGTKFLIKTNAELYGNISQNYRAINFTDLRISNPNMQVDSAIHDERGFTADLGIRGNKNETFIYDVSVFYIYYQGRIGQVLMPGKAPLYLDYRFRTNVADARNMGVEVMTEVDVLRLINLKKTSRHHLSVFVNGSFIEAVYLNSENKSLAGKQVEMVPPLMLRNGINYRCKDLKASLQYSHTMKHFSDATNSVRTANAVEGIIPSYHVVDFSLGYRYRKFSAELSCNNILDASYFTRRADAYPGPGIIPADGRSFYFTLGYTLSGK